MVGMRTTVIGLTMVASLVLGWWFGQRGVLAPGDAAMADGDAAGAQLGDPVRAASGAGPTRRRKDIPAWCIWKMALRASGSIIEFLHRLEKQLPPAE